MEAGELEPRFVPVDGAIASAVADALQPKTIGTVSMSDYQKIVEKAAGAVVKPTFTRAALETLQECRGIVDQRAGEYADSWALENIRTPFLDNVLDGFGVKLSAEEKRLIVLASLCDVKISRLVGPWKRDTAVDLINYTAALTTLYEEHLNGSRV